MPIPAGPSTPVFYSAFYKNLSALVKSFVQIFFTPTIYKSAFFSGVLTATLFAGTYTLPKAMGGGTYSFALGVPGPEAGNGIGFLVAAIVAAIAYTLYRRRAVV